MSVKHLAQLNNKWYMLYSHRQMGPPQNIGKNEDAINNFAVAWTVHK